MLSIIIPTKEEPSLMDLLREITASVKEEHEIIIIDDSRVTPSLTGARVFTQRKQGLGNAILEGVARARGQEVVVMDADFSHDPSDIPRLIAKLREGYHIVLGSRYCERGRTEDTGSRRVLSNTFSSTVYCSLANLLLRTPLADPMSGFAAFRKAAYLSLPLRPRGYKIHLEAVYKGKKRSAKVAEIPIVFRPRREGKSKTGFREALRTLIFLFELRLGTR